MSKPDSSSTQTQTIEPPAFAKPYIESGFGQASNLYNQGGPQFYPGDTFVPFSPQSEQAMQMTQDRATQGSPVTGAAQNYVTQSLNGDFMNNNPWLDQTFNRAVQQTRGALDSQFATAGRDLVSQLPYRTEQVNNLANNIYGGAYDAERNRQQGTLPFASQLANQDYIDIAALQGVGSQVEGQANNVLQGQMDRWNFNQMRPEQALDSYFSRINGLTGGYNQQSQPIYRNPASSALGGAATGAALGSMFGSSNPLWMLGGGLLGLYGG
jgi:hypothetical protein